MTVYLVGAGPGDAGLITVRGAEVLGRADVVFYDRLSSVSLLDLAPATAERVAVGKTPRGPSTPQDDINRQLVERGRQGLTVVRLKSGDPFVFGRGGEEAQALTEAGVPFVVVPGVTAGIAAAAYAGVPVTHRGVSRAVTFVTGQGDPWAAPDTDWDAVARLGGTVVLYMAVANRDEIANRLMAGGMAADTPTVAIIEGTRPEQEVMRMTLGELGAAALRSPAIIVIGAVAALDVSWLSGTALAGARVVVTRTGQQAAELTAALVAAGAEVIAAPVIAMSEPSDDGDALRAAVARVTEGDYQWIVFTSANAVSRFFAVIRDARSIGVARVAAVGAATAAALVSHGVVADFVPTQMDAKGLASELPDPPGSVLVPQAAGARSTLADGLRQRGFGVDVVEAYRTTVHDPGPEALAAAATADVVVFTSSSTVDNFVALAGTAGVPRGVVCIGSATAATAASHGIAVSAIAEEPTAGGLVEAVRRTLQP